MKRHQGIIITLLSAILMAGIFSAQAETARRKKARHLYAAGALRQAQADDHSAYEYYKRAWETDPTYPEAAWAYASQRLYIPLDTLQSRTELDRSLEMMKPYIDAYPEDLYENMFYGYVAGQLSHHDEGIRVLERTYSLHPSSSDILFALSDAYARKGDWPNAVEAIDRYEHQQGHSAAVSNRKLSFMLIAGDTVGAIAEVDKLVELNPADATFAILHGNLLDIVSSPDSALVWYKRAERLAPDAGLPKLAIADHYKSKGDSAEYDKKMYEVLLAEDLDLNQKTDLLADYLHTLLKENQDHKRGNYLFSVLESQYPHEPRLLDLAARYSAATGDFTDAAEKIRYAIDQDLTNTRYWGQLMAYLAGDGKYDDALETYQRALTYVTPDDNLRNYYINLADLGKHYDKAAEMVVTMIREVQPGLRVDTLLTLSDLRRDISAADLDQLGQLFVRLGDIYYEANDTTASFRMYQNAITFDDSNAMAKNNYAYFLSQQGGDLDKAEELSRSSLSGFDADNPTYLDTYAWILYLKGKPAEALEWQQKAVSHIEEEDSSGAEIYDHLGDIKAALSDWPGAIEAWQKAIKLYEFRLNVEKEPVDAIEKKVKDASQKVPADDGVSNGANEKDEVKADTTHE